MRTAKYDLYMRALNNTLDECLANDEQDIKSFVVKCIVYGVKAMNTREKRDTVTREDAEHDFQQAELIKAFMGSLTPAELVNLFPIKKNYDGDRWECKDYFYTRDYIKALPADQPIGKEIDALLWEYVNVEIQMFIIHCMGCLDNLRRFDGQPSVMEEWAGMNGITTYNEYTDHQGKKFLLDRETGKTIRVKKARPGHIRVVE